MMTDQIYSLRWRLAAALLKLDPERDPSPELSTLCDADVTRGRAALGREVADLLSERMALLDAERPGVTIIDLLKGMLEATKEKRAREWAAEFTDATIREFAPFMPSGYTLQRRPGLGWIWQTGETSGAVWPTPQAALAEAWRGAVETASHRVRVLETGIADMRSEERAVRRGLLAAKAAGGSLTTEQLAEDIAARLTATGDEMAKQRARADMAESDLTAVRARSNRRADALRALGWDGEEDPEVWAPRRLRMMDISASVIEILSPLRTAIGAMGTSVPKRIVELAVQRIEGDARWQAEAERKATILRDTLKLYGWTEGSTTVTSIEQTLAAHRWRAADLEAVLEHERKMRKDTDAALVEVTRPIWPLLGGRFIKNPDGVLERMVRVMQEQHKVVTHNGSIPEFSGPDE